MFNRNFALHSHINRNVVHPSISLDPVECRQNTTVEIVEPNNSSDDCEETNKASSFNYEPELHPWSYISQDLYSEDNYKINKIARERRRLNKSKEGLDNTTTKQERSPDQTFPSFYCFERDTSKYNDYKSYVNRQVNCFTIPSNLGTSSTSSDDQNVSIDGIQCGDTNPYHDISNARTQEYDEVYFSQDDTDKRTIWIYSFKNKRILSENDYILANIPSKDSSSYSSSTDELELEPTRESQSTRLATPIPFIPRLDLNLTSNLPTVTEVAEPTKHSSCATEITSEPICQTTGIDLINENAVAPKMQKPINDTDPVVEKQYCEPTVIVTKDLSETEDINLSYKEDNAQENGTFLQEKPHIQIGLKPLTKNCEISDPIEKLEGNWIAASSYINKHTNPLTYQVDLPSPEVKPSTPKTEINNTFFINNLSLLKPAEWNEYMPITDSTPSLELSIRPNVDTKKSWFMKLFKCVKCFKE